MKTKSKKKLSQDRVVESMGTLLILLLAITILYPLIYIVSCSFSSGDALMSGKVRFLPVDFTLDGYQSVFEYKQIWTGYRNSIIYTVIGTALSITIFCRGQAPDVSELVNTMLDNAIVLLKENEHPIVHSDRGCHYRWSGWIQRMDEAGLTRSMSKKGCSPDNSACEGFFG